MSLKDTCKGCLKHYSNKYNLLRHQKKCVAFSQLQNDHQYMSQQIQMLIEENNKLKEEINMLKILNNSKNTNSFNKINSDNTNNNNFNLYLTPITDERFAHALSSVPDYFETNPTKSLSANDFFLNVMKNMDLQNSMVIADASRKKTLWLNGDDDNKVVQDQHAHHFLQKFVNVPEYSETLKSVIQLNNIIDHDVKEDSRNINHHLLYNDLVHKNIPNDISKPFVSDLLSKQLFNKNQISQTLIDNKLTKEKEDEKEFETKFNTLFDSMYLMIQEPFFILFLSFSQSVYMLRKLFNNLNDISFQKRPNSDKIKIIFKNEEVSIQTIINICRHVLKTIINKKEKDIITYFHSLSNDKAEILYGDNAWTNYTEKKEWIYNNTKQLNKDFSTHFFYFE